MIRWAEPGYVVGFTTRVGGESAGPYASLNLGLATGDDPTLVSENRRLACLDLDADPWRLSANLQAHSATVHQARDSGSERTGDGLWSDDPGLPMLALTADCVPIAIAVRGGRRLALLHAGWRGLSSGLVAAGVAALGGGELAAAIGPSAGPCCYEVGREVSDLFDEDLTAARRLDLWTATERQLREAGVPSVERVDLCTICNPELFFSHRRDGMPRGAQGAIGYVA